MDIIIHNGSIQSFVMIFPIFSGYVLYIVFDIKMIDINGLL